MAVVWAPTLCPDPGRWECGTRSKQPTVFRLVRLDYYYISSLTRGIQNLLRQEPEREQKPIPGTKFDKETIAGHVGGQNWSYIIVRRPDSGVLRILRLCSSSAQACSGSAPACLPSAQVCSPSAHVKAVVAHVRRLKQNRRRGKLILSLWVSLIRVPANHSFRHS
jgi:hypothetical protein